MPGPRSHETAHGWLLAIEILCGLAVWLGVFVLFVNHIEATGFIVPVSEGPHPDTISAYRAWAPVTAAALLVMLVAAFRRRARWLFLGHAITAFVAIAAVLLFAVPSIDFRSLIDPPPVEQSYGPGYEPCYSGSDGCPGG
ncbi:DUF6234 family protein [Promicromonospora iranensis]|uniref:Lysylphosphatidylglycerol synthetase-like protein (DUF2156 family) n=1 Tax=Promicromonospora iranensis TaxID=1105144 RepID=A0ABU2CVG9_9MICO|nr:DUF6234 family protein [Promicromonospora iranensis]MDR7385330.1 lysylphosphatidylglycerol synthetase-like protein (DUF2156 family) [Promicromonospora iranensis]